MTLARRLTPLLSDIHDENERVAVMAEMVRLAGRRLLDDDVSRRDQMLLAQVFLEIGNTLEERTDLIAEAVDQL